MSNTITVQKALFAHFNHSSGVSRPGAVWAIRIEGERAGTVMVRTYFTKNIPDDAEKKAAADKAVLLVREKLEQGWIPRSEMLEVE